MKNRIETALRDSIPTDCMIGDDEVSTVADAVVAALFPHVAATHCGLTREDFLPGDPPCIDGGAVDEHPWSCVEEA